MVFLEDFSCIYSTPFTLLDVQNAVFEHFADLRASSRVPCVKSVREEGEDTEHDSVTCICRLIPIAEITPDDLTRYRQLLASVCSHSPDQTTTRIAKRGKQNRTNLDELQALHARVTRAQVTIQKQLLDCEPCAHFVLPSLSESLLMEFVSERQMLHWKNNTSQRLYARHELIVDHDGAAATSIQYRSNETSGAYKLVVPAAGTIRFTHSEELKRSMSHNAKQNNLMANTTSGSSKIDQVPFFLLPESVLIMLFAQSTLTGVYIPFTISEVAGTGKKAWRKLHFEDVIWSCPPGPRTRARLFYECATRFHCYRYELQQKKPDGPIGTPSSSRDSSVPSGRIPTASEPVNSSMHSVVEQPKTKEETENIGNRKSTKRKRTKAIGSSPTKPIAQGTEQSSPLHANHKLSSKRTRAKHTVPETPVRRSNRRITTPGSSSTPNVTRVSAQVESSEEEADETELGNLSIDVAPLDAECSAELSVDLSTLRQEVLSTCTVVTRVGSEAKLSCGKTIVDTSGPVSPIVIDAPASPSSPLVDDPVAVTADRDTPTVTRVIPLEPVESPSRLPSCASPIRRTSPDSNSAADQLGRVPNPSSFATLELGQKTVVVQYENTIWSPEASCQACSSQSAQVGQCPLWPSCESLRERWIDSQSSQSQSNTDGSRPIYVQIKPEYLGDWGCEVLSPCELAEAWLGSVLRNKADIVRVRVRVDSGEIVWVEYQPLDDLLSSHPNFKPEVNAGAVSALLDKLISLSPGSYLLAQDSSAAYELYKSTNAQDPLSASGLSESGPSPNVLDLHDVLGRFGTTSSALVNLSSLCAVQDTATLESQMDMNSSWLSVQRAMLDLDIPAGLELKSTGDPGRALRLPALPTDRIPLRSGQKSLGVKCATQARQNGVPAERAGPSRTRKSMNRPKSQLASVKDTTPGPRTPHPRRTARSALRKSTT